VRGLNLINWRKRVGISLLLFIFVIGLLAPWVSPHGPLAVDLSKRLLSPNIQYPFGTDHLGRCILSRIIYGIRVSVIYSVIIMLSSFVVSLPIALFIGYFRGRVDYVVMRFIDVTLAIPDMVLTITIVGILGPSLLNMIMAILIVRWTSYVRLIRSLVMKACEEDYILSARMSGNSHFRIKRRYIFPVILPNLVLFGTLDMGKIVLFIAALSFLGLGTQPPTPEWGSMLHDATSYFQVAPFVMIFPGMAIFLFILACQLIGD
jgi:peptide/nickel transport system permease protein